MMQRLLLVNGFEEFEQIHLPPQPLGNLRAKEFQRHPLCELRIRETSHRHGKESVEDEFQHLWPYL
jgi:hypothetical protein